MKKKNIFRILLAALMTVSGLTSCKRCVTCTYYGSVYEICREQYRSKVAFDAAVAYYESYGARCR